MKANAALEHLRYEQIQAAREALRSGDLIRIQKDWTAVFEVQLVDGIWQTKIQPEHPKRHPRPAYGILMKGSCGLFLERLSEMQHCIVILANEKVWRVAEHDILPLGFSLEDKPV